MIPILIVYMLKKTRKGTLLLERFAAIKSIIVRLLLLIAMLLVTNTYANNSKKISESIAYNVVKNDKVIGTITIVKTQYNNGVTYKLESKITAKYVLEFNIVGKEKSIFRNGELVYSHVYRKVNKKIKTDHEIMYVNDIYKSGEEDLDIKAIQGNLIKLYFVEPIGVQEVFSDNMKKMVDITALGGGKYKIEFSKNKFNILHYQNGRCVKIEATSALFDVDLIVVTP